MHNLLNFLDKSEGGRAVTFINILLFQCVMKIAPYPFNPGKLTARSYNPKIIHADPLSNPVDFLENIAFLPWRGKEAICGQKVYMMPIVRLLIWDLPTMGLSWISPSRKTISPLQKISQVSVRL